MLSRRLVAAASAWTLASAGLALADDVRLVDDRGEPVAAPIEVCIVTGLERSCQHVERGLLATSADFDSITAEGPEHGPLSIRRQDLLAGGDGAARLVVPRKARLRVRQLPAGPVSLSLYRSDDPSFRRPAARIPSSGGDRIFIPAGDFVLSVAAPDRAPDLHLLSAIPGGDHMVQFRSRPGWSLVVRTVTKETREPLPEVSVEIASAPGYGPALRARTTETNRAGLAVVSGLSTPLATATLSRRGWIEQREPGLSASPGSFAFREAAVARGGSLRAVVTVDGLPTAGATCRLLREVPGPRKRGEEPWVTVQQGTTGPDGIWRAEGISAGSYTLKAAPAGAVASSITAVAVNEGQETAVGMHLRLSIIKGAVTRGTRPAAGYRLRAAAIVTSSAAEVATATTDEEGEYRLPLWATGEYLVTLQSPEGVSVDMKLVSLDVSGITQDFTVADAEVRGTVTDESGRPVTGASVGIRWKNRVGVELASADGTFEFPVEAGGGTAELTAFAAGHRPSEPVKVRVPEDGAPAPAVLVVKKSHDVEGTVVTAAGRPVADAWIASYEIGPDGMPWQVGAATSDAEGRFSVPRTRSETVRLFVTGPGCPLSASEVPAGAGPLTLSCAEAPANLEVILRDELGRPIGEEMVTMRRAALVVPREVVATHLARLGLPGATDGSGRLTIPALAPGDYDLYLSSSSNPMTMAAGLPHGHLGAASLAPLTTTELEVTVRQPGE